MPRSRKSCRYDDVGELPTHLPKHVAIIMDGNGRWAKKRYLPREAGHYAGMNAVRETVRAACDMRAGKPHPVRLSAAKTGSGPRPKWAR